jgi:transcriptional regulator with XRE-family HTH domain
MHYDPPALFGKRLAELRKERGVSQEGLALASGLARSYVGEVERGKRNIALINICILADTLGVPPSVLLDFGAPTAAPRGATGGKPVGDTHRG